MQASIAPEANAAGHRFKTMAAAVTALDALTLIETFDVSCCDLLFIAVTIGEEDLTQWQFLVNGNPAGTDIDISSTSGLGLSWVTGDPDTLAVGTHGIGVNVQGIDELAIKCKSALGTATVLLEAGGN